MPYQPFSAQDMPTPPPPVVAPLRPPSRAPWVLAALVLIVVGAAGYWGWEERARLLDEVKKAQVAAQTAEKTAAARIAQLELDKATLEGERTSLLAERETLSKSVQEKASELEALKGTTDKGHEQAEDSGERTQKAQKDDKAAGKDDKAAGKKKKAAAHKKRRK